YMIGEETLFDGVYRLPPGHALVIEGGQQQLHPFWEFGRDRVGVVGAREGESEEAILEDVRAHLAESVRLHLRSDVPLGLFLSAGVDSASMLALMAAELRAAGGNQPVRTFTVGYDMKTRDNE